MSTSRQRARAIQVSKQIGGGKSDIFWLTDEQMAPFGPTFRNAMPSHRSMIADQVHAKRRTAMLSA
ncbi:hypothetical protein [Thalassovita aquimarina]|uniref:Uncharacterized protein n=1 Tax=Thalassovita aquimarina TaxID=2785917 RepID=A0ABS5HR05_9RHOB|nr:hypothetical protein [Thalassovita aquimarina]MBR9651391.1 hypothetical protein [Thalassovita aquimarina]